MDWRLKAALQGLLSRLPGGTRINSAHQRWLGGLRDVDGAVDARILDDWLILTRQLRELRLAPEGLACLEVGTGWLPVLPFCFSLAGARVIHTFDVKRHLRPDLAFKTVSRLEAHLPAIAEVAGTSQSDVTARYASLGEASSQEQLLRLARIQYHAPADASLTGLDEQSVDVVFSNDVLEHVSTPGIQALLAESRRVLTPRGVSIHAVNCGDHYAGFDHSITPINYLKYSEQAWRRWNNALQYQNRLRPRDFAHLVADAGLELVLYEFNPVAELLEALPSMGIAPEFRGYPAEQLCSTSVTVAGRV